MCLMRPALPGGVHVRLGSSLCITWMHHIPPACWCRCCPPQPEGGIQSHYLLGAGGDASSATGAYPAAVMWPLPARSTHQQVQPWLRMLSLQQAGPAAWARGLPCTRQGASTHERLCRSRGRAAWFPHAAEPASRLCGCAPSPYAPNGWHALTSTGAWCQPCYHPAVLLDDSSFGHSCSTAPCACPTGQCM